MLPLVSNGFPDFRFCPEMLFTLGIDSLPSSINLGTHFKLISLNCHLTMFGGHIKVTLES